MQNTEQQFHSEEFHSQEFHSQEFNSLLQQRDELQRRLDTLRQLTHLLARLQVLSNFGKASIAMAELRSLLAPHDPKYRNLPPPCRSNPMERVVDISRTVEWKNYYAIITS
jgi:hypothetical protein